MKYIITIIGMLLLSGCVTERACQRKFPPQIITVDSIIQTTETIYRDTTIFVQLPADTVRDTVEVAVLNGISNSRPSIHETDLAWSKAQVINGKLFHELIQKDSVLARVIENAIRESSTNTQETKIITKVVKENYITGWQWFQIWTGRILAVLLIAALIVKFALR